MTSQETLGNMKVGGAISRPPSHLVVTYFQVEPEQPRSLGPSSLSHFQVGTLPHASPRTLVAFIVSGAAAYGMKAAFETKALWEA